MRRLAASTHILLRSPRPPRMTNAKRFLWWGFCLSGICPARLRQLRTHLGILERPAPQQWAASGAVAKTWSPILSDRAFRRNTEMQLFAQGMSSQSRSPSPLSPSSRQLLRNTVFDCHVQQKLKAAADSESVRLRQRSVQTRGRLCVAAEGEERVGTDVTRDETCTSNVLEDSTAAAARDVGQTTGGQRSLESRSGPGCEQGPRRAEACEGDVNFLCRYVCISRKMACISRKYAKYLVSTVHRPVRICALFSVLWGFKRLFNCHDKSPLCSWHMIKRGWGGSIDTFRY